MSSVTNVTKRKADAQEQILEGLTSIVFTFVFKLEIITCETVQMQLDTFKPVYNGPVYSGHFVYNGH